MRRDMWKHSGSSAGGSSRTSDAGSTTEGVGRWPTSTTPSYPSQDEPHDFGDLYDQFFLKNFAGHAASGNHVGTVAGLQPRWMPPTLPPANTFTAGAQPPTMKLSSYSTLTPMVDALKTSLSRAAQKRRESASTVMQTATNSVAPSPSHSTAAVQFAVPSTHSPYPHRWADTLAHDATIESIPTVSPAPSSCSTSYAPSTSRSPNHSTLPPNTPHLTSGASTPVSEFSRDWSVLQTPVLASSVALPSVADVAVPPPHFGVFSADMHAVVPAFASRQETAAPKNSGTKRRRNKAEDSGETTKKKRRRRAIVDDKFVNEDVPVINVIPASDGPQAVEEAPAVYAQQTVEQESPIGRQLSERADEVPAPVECDGHLEADSAISDTLFDFGSTLNDCQELTNTIDDVHRTQPPVLDENQIFIEALLRAAVSTRHGTDQPRASSGYELSVDAGQQRAEQKTNNMAVSITEAEKVQDDPFVAAIDEACKGLDPMLADMLKFRPVELISSGGLPTSADENYAWAPEDIGLQFVPMNPDFWDFWNTHTATASGESGGLVDQRWLRLQRLRWLADRALTKYDRRKTTNVRPVHEFKTSRLRYVMDEENLTIDDGYYSDCDGSLFSGESSPIPDIPANDNEERTPEEAAQAPGDDESLEDILALDEELRAELAMIPSNIGYAALSQDNDAPAPSMSAIIATQGAPSTHIQRLHADRGSHPAKDARKKEKSSAWSGQQQQGRKVKADDMEEKPEKPRGAVKKRKYAGRSQK